MGRYLLDSNAFLRFKGNPQTLSQEARETIEDRRNELYISLASLWEMGIKAANGKLDLFTRMIASGPDALIRSLGESGFAVMTITLEHALAAPLLPQHHRDPFDRMMIVQALMEELTLISSDATFSRYAGLKLLDA